jgi:hypothetical protein
MTIFLLKTQFATPLFYALYYLVFSKPIRPNINIYFICKSFPYSLSILKYTQILCFILPIKQLPIYYKLQYIHIAIYTV